MVRKHDKCDLNVFFNSDNQRLLNKNAIDLLSKMLLYDQNERISAEDSLKHPYFSKYLDNKKNARKQEK